MWLGVTICDYHNLAVSTWLHLKFISEPVTTLHEFDFFHSALPCDPYSSHEKAFMILWLHGPWSQLLICLVRVLNSVEVGSSIINFICRPLLFCYYPYIACILFGMHAIPIHLLKFWMFCLYIYINKHTYTHTYIYRRSLIFTTSVGLAVLTPNMSFEAGDDLHVEVSSLFIYGPASCKRERCWRKEGDLM